MSKFEFKSRLLIPEFSGYHCSYNSGLEHDQGKILILKSTQIKFYA